MCVREISSWNLSTPTPGPALRGEKSVSVVILRYLSVIPQAALLLKRSTLAIHPTLRSWNVCYFINHLDCGVWKGHANFLHVLMIQGRLFINYSFLL